MANEAIISYKTTINHIVNGAQVSNGGLSVQGDIDNAISSTNTGDYPLCNVILTFTPSATTVAGDTIDLYRRDIQIVGTSDAPVPVSDFLNKYMGSFVVDVDTIEQFLQLSGIPLAKECEFYIFNNLDGALTINNTWDLDVQPYTYGSA